MHRSVLRLARIIGSRGFASEATLHERFAAAVPKLQAEKKACLDKYKDVVVGTCTVDQAYGGMRSVLSMVTETSLLDPQEGIRFRGYSIPECQKLLPAAKAGGEPLPEGMFWLLLTGEIPTATQVKGLSAEWAARSDVPAWVENLILSLPKTMHPMTALSIGIMALQKDSKFAKAYSDGVNKKDYWKFALEDSMDCVAKLPRVASLIYRNTYHGGKIIAPKKELDWSANFAHMLGFQDPMFDEVMRMYLTIHTDHEGGNVSAHTTHLVGSALSDPYLSLAAGMNGLAGPLHGLANQEVLIWIKEFRDKYKTAGGFTKDSVEKALWDTLNSGQVVPGYGHAVLRKTDPRFACQREFCQKHIKNDELVDLVGLIYEVAPGVLTKHGKTKNPWPNVDAHSGVLLQHYKLTQEDFYTVMFGVSRALGVLASLTIDRALGLAIERPKSETTQSIAAIAQKILDGQKK